MKKKDMFLIIMLLLISLTASSQVVDKAKIEVLYSCEMVGNRNEPKRKTKDETILLVGNNYTVFFSFLNYTADSLRKARPEEYSPQVKSRGADGTEIVKRAGETTGEFAKKAEAIGGIPIVHPPRTRLKTNIYNRAYSFIERRSGVMTVYDFIPNQEAGTYFAYSEPLPRPAWHIHPDIDTIAAYPCQKASVSYGGREWTAWFAPSIPISEGPWKLRGLPGLILKAQSADGEFLWIATSVSRSSARTIAKDQSNDYRMVGKEEVLKARREAFASIAPIEYNEIEVVK